MLNRTFKQEKSIFCSMVLRLMDTENYANNYCDSLSLVLELFPEIDREKLEKELDKIRLIVFEIKNRLLN